MKKLLNKKGFSFAEVLVAVAILAIFASMAIVGTTALFGTSEKMMNVSKAAVLGSDVMQAITNELRFGEDFAMSSDAITYNSTTYGDNCSIKVENGELVIVQTSSAKDPITGEEKISEKSFYPLSSAAYGDVKLQSVTFTITTSEKSTQRQIINCEVTIVSDGKTAWQKSIDIVPLYQKNK